MGYFIFNPATNNLAIEEIHHIKDVLRLKPGTEILATDGNGSLYNLVITNLKPFQIDIIHNQTLAKSNTYTRCIISNIKVPLLELVIQKLTEIGIDEIIITKTKFAQINLDKLESKLNRWHTIINTACKQSERVYFPKLSVEELDKITYIDNSVNLIGDTQYTTNPTTIQEINLSQYQNVNLLIGPEGGFEKSEYLQLINEKNYIPIHLTPHILRTETAAIVGAGIIKILSQ